MNIVGKNNDVRFLAIKLNDSDSKAKWFTAYSKSRDTFSLNFKSGDYVTIYLPCCTYAGIIDYIEYSQIDKELWIIYFSLLDNNTTKN